MESYCAAAASYSTPRILGRSRLLALSAVFGATLPPILHTDRIERAADQVIANSRKILHATASDQHDRMLLEVMADARNIGRNLHPVCQPNPRNFP